MCLTSKQYSCGSVTLTKLPKAVFLPYVYLPQLHHDILVRQVWSPHYNQHCFIRPLDTYMLLMILIEFCFLNKSRLWLLIIFSVNFDSFQLLKKLVTFTKV